MTAVVDLARELIARPSVSPEDGGCQALIGERLAALGFSLESMPFGDVTNLWARRGESAPLFCFAGHTDVVPPGPAGAWSHDPFEPVIREGFLCGRGAADMKSSIAAMVVAVERLVGRAPDHRGSIAFLLTSDEEADALDGTRQVVARLEDRDESIDYCLVGEPSSHQRLGDTVRIGRRGSLNATLTVYGKQGHVAFPELADSAIHRALPALAALTEIVWDGGNEHFPPTGFQISNVRSGTGANNVIPGNLVAQFNLRYSTELTEASIIARVEQTLRDHDLRFEIDWQSSGLPFLSRPGALTDAVQDSIDAIMQHRPVLSTGGGTSDGRFIAPTGAEVVELGPLNDTIHQVDERVLIEDLDRLVDIYESILERLLV